MFSILTKSAISKSIRTTGFFTKSIASRLYTTGDDADVVVTKKDHLLTIRLNRPKKFNAVTRPMYLAITDALNKGAQDDDVTMAVLTGTGKYYSAGNDLAAMATTIGSDLAASAEEGRAVLHDFQSAFVDFPKPLVAAVNGPAIGIMVTTLALADIVWAADSATFSAPFSGTAQTPEGCATETFPQILGPSLTNEIFLLNRQLSAQEALGAQFISRILPTDNFHSTVEENLLKVLKNASTPALIAIKKIMRTPEKRKLLRDVSLSESHALVERWLSPDFPEFVMKFLSRKK